MNWVPVNFNDLVRFKVTPKGHEHLAELSRVDPVYARYPVQFPVDADGWSTTELWHLALIFGSEFYNGCHVPVETRIQIAIENEPRDAEIARLRGVINCACNALTDSILMSGNDVQTNLHWGQEAAAGGGGIKA